MLKHPGNQANFVFQLEAISKLVFWRVAQTTCCLGPKDKMNSRAILSNKKGNFPGHRLTLNSRENFFNPGATRYFLKLSIGINFPVLGSLYLQTLQPSSVLRLVYFCITATAAAEGDEYFLPL